ncbi:MAG: FAD-dependent oxidoreductase [Anaerolineae bacterium]|nr:FAD-dependent oxidoreductase [Anaerolineae bacterium]
MTADVLILGAGLSGLMAARTVQARGLSVHLLDKGRSVGGRLATRRVQQGMADTGAQFFTARTDEMKQAIAGWLGEGLVTVWGYGWSDGSLKRTPLDGHPRYITKGGMNSLAKHLAEGLPVSTESEIITVERIGQTWQLTDAQGRIYTGDHLLMTAPVPQSLALLNKTAIPLTDADRAALQRIEYGPCLCGLFVLEGSVNLPEPGAVQDFNKPVYWLGDNQAKGISGQRVITAHMEARYSRQHYDDPDETSLAFMLDALQPYLGEDARVIEQQLKKWRYSVPLTTHAYDTLAAENLPLYFAGDAFGGRGRMEGAYMSGLAAGAAIAKAAGK